MAIDLFEDCHTSISRILGGFCIYIYIYMFNCGEMVVASWIRVLLLRNPVLCEYIYTSCAQTLHLYTYPHVHIYIYIYVYIYVCICNCGRMLMVSWIRVLLLLNPVQCEVIYNMCMMFKHIYVYTWIYIYIYSIAVRCWWPHELECCCCLVQYCVSIYIYIQFVRNLHICIRI